MASTQKPCPRCGSADIKYVPSACLCSDRHSNPCWSYPLCRRCGYSNYGSSANSEGTYWEPFTSSTPMSTELVGLALVRTIVYDAKLPKVRKTALKAWEEVQKLGATAESNNLASLTLAFLESELMRKAHYPKEI
jgi:hypothetical protein